MLFFPLGILLPLVWPRLRVRRAVGIALALSVGIELLQLLSSAWGSYRAADVNDVILNVFGACLGLAVVTLLRWRPGGRGESVRWPSPSTSIRTTVGTKSLEREIGRAPGPRHRARPQFAARPVLIAVRPDLHASGNFSGTRPHS
jgi:hypothetical protein